MQKAIAQPATMQGQAARIPAAKAQPAVLQATIQIKRAATGKVEEYTITGTPVKEGA
jgi:hypothetical protein